MIWNRPSILITDDDAAFREALRELFVPRGFRTILAGDGEEALKVVHQREVHIVLMDMHMPKLTGLDTLRLLKRFRTILPCILLSANLDEGIVEQAKREHAFSVLSKPITSRQITSAVTDALKQTYNWHAS